MLRQAGVTAVSQTAGPETVLAGEAVLPYALVGYATDYANGVRRADARGGARSASSGRARRPSPASWPSRCRASRAPT